MGMDWWSRLAEGLRAPDRELRQPCQAFGAVGEGLQDYRCSTRIPPPNESNRIMKAKLPPISPSDESFIRPGREIRLAIERQTRYFALIFVFAMIVFVLLVKYLPQVG